MMTKTLSETNKLNERRAAETLLQVWEDLENETELLDYTLVHGVQDEDREPLTDLFGPLDFEGVLRELRRFRR